MKNKFKVTVEVQFAENEEWSPREAFGHMQRLLENGYLHEVGYSSLIRHPAVRSIQFAPIAVGSRNGEENKFADTVNKAPRRLSGEGHSSRVRRLIRHWIFRFWFREDVIRYYSAVWRQGTRERQRSSERGKQHAPATEDISTFIDRMNRKVCL